MTPIKKQIRDVLEKVADIIENTEPLLSDEQKGHLEAAYNLIRRLAARPRHKPPRHIVKEHISTNDNVHWKLEFNVPTDVFSAMVDTFAEIVFPKTESIEDTIQKVDKIMQIKSILEEMAAPEEAEGEPDAETSEP